MLIRTQGLRTWMQARASLDRGEMPVRELFDGLCLFAAGILLMTPGFFTDALALLLLLPPLRHLLAERLVRSMVVMHGGRGDAGRGDAGQQRPVVIETEFHEVCDDDEDREGVVEGKSVSVRVDIGGRRIIKKKNNNYNIQT